MSRLYLQTITQKSCSATNRYTKDHITASFGDPRTSSVSYCFAVPSPMSNVDCLDTPQKNISVPCCLNTPWPVWPPLPLSVHHFFASLRELFVRQRPPEINLIARSLGYENACLYNSQLFSCFGCAVGYGSNPLQMQWKVLLASKQTSYFPDGDGPVKSAGKRWTARASK